MEEAETFLEQRNMDAFIKKMAKENEEVQNGHAQITGHFLPNGNDPWYEELSNMHGGDPVDRDSR